jgi:RNA polymerase sigma-70 factor (ECF subfamily)
MDIDLVEWQRHRRYLLAVAYRLLGSVTEAEDAVQEAYLRLRAAPDGDVTNLRAWLSTVVSRICLDELRSARARRESYVGPWLPEPLVGTRLDDVGEDVDPADRVTLTESVEMAMLTVLERLSPPERVAFVLHDVFGMGFGDIARIVGRSDQACRQLAHRARRHVRGEQPRFTVSEHERRRTVAAFLDATAQGDLPALVALLDPDVVMRTDAGGATRAALNPVYGRDKVGRLLLALGEQYRMRIRMAEVGGTPGFVAFDRDRLIAVTALAVTGGRITAVDVVINPDKLRHIGELAGTGDPVWSYGGVKEGPDQDV